MRASSHFSFATEVDAEIKVAVALLVATVLELVREDGRAFAKYSKTINCRDIEQNERAEY